MLQISLTESDPLLKGGEDRRGKKHPKCQGEKDYWGEFDCGYGTTLLCEDCRYCVGAKGRKDPEAKCNQE